MINARISRFISFLTKCSLKAWIESSEKNVYIGRNVPYVDGAVHSKWHNPYAVKKFGIDDSLAMYEYRVRSDKRLWDTLDELEGKTLGCWCVPHSRCHGQVLFELLREKKSSGISCNE